MRLHCASQWDFQSDPAHILARTEDVSGAPKVLHSEDSCNGKGTTFGAGAFSNAQFVNSKFAITVCFESFSRANLESGLFGQTVLKLQQCHSSYL